MLQKSVLMAIILLWPYWPPLLYYKVALVLQRAVLMAIILLWSYWPPLLYYKVAFGVTEGCPNGYYIPVVILATIVIL